MLKYFCFQVNFIISGSTVANRRRLRNNNQQMRSRIDESESQLYRDLARTSGGQVVEMATSELTAAINILTESTSASLVASPRSDYKFSRLQDFTRVICFYSISRWPFCKRPATREPPMISLSEWMRLWLILLFSSLDAPSPTPSPAPQVTLPCTDALNVCWPQDFQMKTYENMLNVDCDRHQWVYTVFSSNMKMVLCPEIRNHAHLCCDHMPSWKFKWAPASVLPPPLIICFCLQENLSKAATRPDHWSLGSSQWET